MKVHICVTIGHVDGESVMLTKTSDIRAARKFLQDYDHEGSSVTVEITADNEDSYRLLEQLALIS